MSWPPRSAPRSALATGDAPMGNRGTLPCQRNPEWWFCYENNHTLNQANAEKARLACMLECRLEQQRHCAELALTDETQFGVWAGVRLPGRQYRDREELGEGLGKLRRIAEGEIYPCDLPENVELIARTEDRKAG